MRTAKFAFGEKTKLNNYHQFWIFKDLCTREVR